MLIYQRVTTLHFLVFYRISQLVTLENRWKAPSPGAPSAQGPSRQPRFTWRGFWAAMASNVVVALRRENYPQGLPLELWRNLWKNGPKMTWKDWFYPWEKSTWGVSGGNCETGCNGLLTQLRNVRFAMLRTVLTKMAMDRHILDPLNFQALLQCAAFIDPQFAQPGRAFIRWGDWKNTSERGQLKTEVSVPVALLFNLHLAISWSIWGCFLGAVFMPVWSDPSTNPVASICVWCLNFPKFGHPKSPKFGRNGKLRLIAYGFSSLKNPVTGVKTACRHGFFRHINFTILPPPVI